MYISSKYFFFKHNLDHFENLSFLILTALVKRESLIFGKKYFFKGCILPFFWI